MKKTLFRQSVNLSFTQRSSIQQPQKALKKERVVNLELISLVNEKRYERFEIGGVIMNRKKMMVISHYKILIII